MTPTAADVPFKFDVVITGVSGVTDFGLCFADSVESSLPFRTHRAIYDISQTFVERQNVANSYGDNAQDFFLTARQRNWSLGEQQKYFRTGQDGRYWMGSNVDVSTPGQVSLSPQVGSLTFAAAAKAACRNLSGHEVLVATATNLYKVDVAGTITDLGTHSCGSSPTRFGMTNDATNAYITGPGGNGIRAWTGAAFGTFSAGSTDIGSLAFLNNTLYGSNGPSLYSFDTGGVATSLFTWKTAAGVSSVAVSYPKMHTFGGKLLISFPYAQESSELWIYDGSGVSRLEVFPENFIVNDIEVLYGVAYIAGSFMKAKDASNTYLQPAILFYDGSQIGLLWKANDYNGTSIASSNNLVGPHPALGVSNGRLIFTDETTGSVMAYDPASGGTSSIGTYTQNSGDSAICASTGLLFLQVRNQTTGYYYPKTTYPTSGYVISSLIDYESSLAKSFRGIKVEFSAASDGDGGSVDIAYQVDSVSGSWTNLKTGATSGTEYTLSGVTGHAIAVKVTINKGTSTKGPVVKSLNVRAAPQLQQFRSGTYIIDCTGTEKYPRQLRDGSYDTITGATLATSLLSTAKATAPFSVTDRFGTFTALVDLNDSEGFDLYEVHPPQDAREGACYIARLKVREV